MMNNTSIWRLNKNGNIIFHTNEDVIRDMHKPSSFFEHPVWAFVILLVGAAIDLFMFKQLFQSFLYDSDLLQWFAIGAFLVAFDLGPVFLGMKQREREQGYKVSMLFSILLVVAFIMGMIVNFWLRIEMRDLILPDLAIAGFSLAGNEAVAENTENAHALTWAIVGGLFPVLTSFVSYGVSHATSNPLAKEEKRLMDNIVLLENDLIQTDAIIKEYDVDSYESMREEDHERYEKARRMVMDIAVAYCDYVRECLKEHIGDTAATNELSKLNNRDVEERLRRLQGQETGRHDVGRVLDFNQSATSSMAL